jgi:hypothetical protein
MLGGLMAAVPDRTQPMSLPKPIHTHGQGLRAIIRTVHEAIGLIDNELPAELRSRSRWTFARALLIEAQKSGKKRDLVVATRQLKQALDNEGWLLEPATAASSS